MFRYCDINQHVSSHVELVFPYKDCVLEGGQTTEAQKRKEVFYNHQKLHNGGTQ